MLKIGDRVKIPAAMDPGSGVLFPEIIGTIVNLDFCVAPDPEYLNGYYPEGWFSDYPFVDCAEEDLIKL